jgi:hypothetical protein
MAAAMIARVHLKNSLQERPADLERGVAALESVRRKRINVVEYV